MYIRSLFNCSVFIYFIFYILYLYIYHIFLKILLQIFHIFLYIFFSNLFLIYLVSCKKKKGMLQKSKKKRIEEKR